VLELARRGKCVLFSTHLLAQAEEICTRIGVIGSGRVLAEGTIPELCGRTGTANLREAFFALVNGAGPARAATAATTAAPGEDDAPLHGRRGFDVIPPRGGVA
jgi:ABC-type multidrug transport system ATPase subunit